MNQNVARVGIVQMRSSADPWENLAVVQAFCFDAELRGCALVAFPENVFYRGPAEGRTEAHLALRGDRVDASFSEFAAAVGEFLANCPIAVSLGSVLEREGSAPLPYNSHWIVSPGGRVETYRKIHLFDYKGETAQYLESRDVAAGCQAVAVDVAGFRAGCSICYDLRFPELYRHLTQRLGAEMLLVPAAFTLETGRAHWHALLRARAIENLAFTLAPAQWGSHRNSVGQEFFCYGHALAYGPWGDLLHEAPETGDALVTVDLDRALVAHARDRLPSWKNSCFLGSIDQVGGA